MASTVSWLHVMWLQQGTVVAFGVDEHDRCPLTYLQHPQQHPTFFSPTYHSKMKAPTFSKVEMNA